MSQFPGRTPSGLFPAGPQRPRYREPHPVRLGPVAFGLGAGALWMLLFGLLAESVRSYGWLTMIAGIAAWLAALLLARYGDRGVALGVAVATAFGWSIGAIVVAAVWGVSGWPLW